MITNSVILRLKTFKSTAFRTKNIYLTLGLKLRTRLNEIIAYLKRRYVAVTAIAIMVAAPLLIRSLIWAMPDPRRIPPPESESALLSAQHEIGRQITAMDKKLAAKRPKSYFLVINSASNEFVLYKGEQEIKRDKCSTGSYVLLKNGENQQWMFKTPKGEFRIIGKTKSPVWKKPDWAFVEAGLPVPSSNHHTRFEYGVLGDFALNLGQGYLIHGTLYQRFLGLPVTHGCIRLNDENLELVFKTLRVGSTVYIY